ncbi:efflux RND transporter permease subunit [Martelella mediterranea]|uniref:HAE1 family hydrophobic/amphiphilic exporter-1 n=1 Tax=Martelella mediterranea TaxID=293089 RepID=A0A4R3NWB7_9HYPH|nr:efflux RND transporter permease subunit [Martelella mediterranea]TCT42119.1 HAE1 family hydrophobic/amphiphilic exporter-1 [Martelella mediterranea]
MNFSAWAIRNPVAPLLLMALLVMIGLQSFNKLPITRFPNVDIPVVAVTVAQSGAAPAELELQVTKKVEDAIASISGVDDINSTITDGTSTTSVLFRMEVSPDEALREVKDAIDNIRADLPATAEEPVVRKIDVEGQAIQTFAVSSPNMSLEELSWFVDDKIERALQGIQGVGKVDRYGGADREIQISLDENKLSSYGITAADVNTQLASVNADRGSGRGQVAGSEQTIRTLGDARNVSELGNTMIALGNGRFARLSALGTITDTYEEPRTFMRHNGEPIVAFGVFRSKGASEVSVANAVQEALATVRTENPDVSIKMVDDAVFYTKGNYEAAMHTLYEGAVLAIIVVFLFLHNWRATLIAATALPLSVIPTFWIMDLMGFSLNIVSLISLTLATGILVDDAIVEVENIERHINMGKTPYRAALDAADEIGLAVIATSFTIIAVFAPVSFMPGIPGQYFIQFGLTVAFAVFFSLVVARLITPVMAAYLLKPGKHGKREDSESNDGRFMRAYTGSVRWTTRWRYATLVAAIGVLIVSLFFMMRIPGDFLPPEDASRIVISVELPPVTRLSETEAVTDAMADRVAAIDGVESVTVLGGSSPMGSLEYRRASITVTLNHLSHSLAETIVNEVFGGIPLIGKYLPKLPIDGREIPQWRIEEQILTALSDIPDARITILNDNGGRDVEFNFLSDNDEDLQAAVATLEAKLRADPLLQNVASEGALPRPELKIHPKKEIAARLGVTPAAIANTVRVATVGDIDANMPKIALDNRLIPIRVRTDLELRRDLAAIRALKIKTADGGLVPLSVVADVEYSEGTGTVNRANRNRVVTIGASLPQGVALDSATQRFRQIVEDTDLPASVTLAAAGDAEIQAEMQESFMNAMMLGLFLVLAVLILLFKDVIQPFTILFSLPLALGGVAIALILTGNSLSMPVLIGLLMLMGIVTKNAILLVDFAKEAIWRGMERRDALVEAGRKRARPIVMTSIAMSAGMIPAALGVGEGASFRSPMAVAVIGGIIVSTVLSLLVVPAFYMIMDDFARLLRRLLSGLVGRRDPDDAVYSNEELGRLNEAQNRKLANIEKRLDDIEQASGEPRDHNPA